MIQFGTAIVLYYYNSNLSDPCYLFGDLFLVLPLAFTMSNTEPCEILSKDTPETSLLKIKLIINVVGQIFIQIGFQVIC